MSAALTTNWADDESSDEEYEVPHTPSFQKDSDTNHDVSQSQASGDVRKFSLKRNDEVNHDQHKGGRGNDNRQDHQRDRGGRQRRDNHRYEHDDRNDRPPRRDHDHGRYDRNNSRREYDGPPRDSYRGGRHPHSGRDNRDERHHQQHQGPPHRDHQPQSPPSTQPPIPVERPKLVLLKRDELSPRDDNYVPNSKIFGDAKPRDEKVYQTIKEQSPKATTPSTTINPVSPITSPKQTTADNTTSATTTTTTTASTIESSGHATAKVHTIKPTQVATTGTTNSIIAVDSTSTEPSPVAHKTNTPSGGRGQGDSGRGRGRGGREQDRGGREQDRGGGGRYHTGGRDSGRGGGPYEGRGRGNYAGRDGGRGHTHSQHPKDEKNAPKDEKSIPKDGSESSTTNLNPTPAIDKSHDKKRDDHDHHHHGGRGGRSGGRKEFGRGSMKRDSPAQTNHKTSATTTAEVTDASVEKEVEIVTESVDNTHIDSSTTTTTTHKSTHKTTHKKDTKSGNIAATEAGHVFHKTNKTIHEKSSSSTTTTTTTSAVTVNTDTVTSPIVAAPLTDEEKFNRAQKMFSKDKNQDDKLKKAVANTKNTFNALLLDDDDEDEEEDDD